MLDIVILSIVAAILFTFLIFGAAVAGVLLVVLFGGIILLAVIDVIIDGLR